MMGFALVWHIWWLVILGFIGAYATFVVFAWRDEVEHDISVETLERDDHKRRSARGPLLEPSEWAR